MMKLALFFAFVALVAADPSGMRRRSTDKVDKNNAPRPIFQLGSEATDDVAANCEDPTYDFSDQCECICAQPDPEERSVIKFAICHNKGNGGTETLNQPRSSLQAHCQKHGDTFGECSHIVSGEFTCKGTNQACCAFGEAMKEIVQGRNTRVNWELKNDNGHQDCGTNNRRLLEAEEEEEVFSIIMVFSPVPNSDGTYEPVTLADVQAMDLDNDEALTLIQLDLGNALATTESESSSDDSTTLIVALVAVIVVCSVILVAAFWKYNIVCFASKSQPVNPSLVPSMPSEGSHPNTPSAIGFDFLGEQTDDHYTIKPFHLQQTS